MSLSSRSLVMAGALLGAIAGAAAEQAEKKEYVPTADVKTLVQTPLAGAEGKQVTILKVTAPPEWVGGRHYHTGPVFVYVAEGSFTIEEEGKPPQTLAAGEVYEEPIGQPMLARNLSSDQPMELLVLQVSDEGEPLMYVAD
jgi:quercetin dioxygenase-like cupin family protein